MRPQTDETEGSIKTTTPLSIRQPNWSSNWLQNSRQGSAHTARLTAAARVEIQPDLT